MKKKVDQPNQNEMRPEYTREILGRGVRGKYANRMTKGAHIVVLEPDVAKAFPDATAVNEALRMLLRVARKAG